MSRIHRVCLALTSLLVAKMAASAVPPEPFTIIVMPDTQKYLALGNDGLGNQTRWIRDHHESLNAKFVIHVGDIVETASKREEWEIASKAFEILDGRIPYAFSLGNHDMFVSKRKESLYHEFFPRSRFETQPTFVDSQGKQADNTYHFLSIGEFKFLILNIDYQPTNGTLTWANKIVAKHPKHRVIVNTHSYLIVNERSLDGQRIWDKFVRKHANIFMVVCGHLSVGRRAAKGDQGNTVHEILANYQGLANGGNGWLRLMRFVPADNKIEVSTHSTRFDRLMKEGDPRWSRLSDNHFTLPYRMSE